MTLAELIAFRDSLALNPNATVNGVPVPELIPVLADAIAHRDLVGQGGFQQAHATWSAKTDWVQEAPLDRFGFNTWGMHRADIMTQHIEELESERDTLRVLAGPDKDYFASLVTKGRNRAAIASAKFPQPNYVLAKLAEEHGEVVKEVVHFAEGRGDWAKVENELIDNLAMLIRLVTEGDETINFYPPCQRCGTVSSRPNGEHYCHKSENS